MSSLLQIQEPGTAATPTESTATKRYGLGIDLGTTHSIISAVCKTEPEVFADAAGKQIIPSVVHYAATQVLVGEAAVKLQATDPANSIASVKRFIGRSYAEVLAAHFTKIYELSESENKLPRFVTRQGEKTPIEVSAEILKYLLSFAEKRLAAGAEVGGAVITVPAYFDDAQRQAVKDAAALAGLNLYRLLNEPTAAAVAYALDKQASGLIVVYDLGGGTFDISVLRLEQGVFRVLATGGNTALGGDDFDAVLAVHIAQQLGLVTATEPKQQLAQLSRQQQQSLRSAAKQLKEQLSKQEAATAELGDFGAGTCQVTRAEFEALISPYIQQSIQIMQQTLAEAQVQAAEVAKVILVGGSTRIPYIRQQLRTLFEREPLCSLDPDLVVAMGAAIQAEVLTGQGADSMLLLDVIPLSLGLETMGGLNEKLIRRNSSIPVAAEHEFTTYKDGQSAMSFHIVQGERELVSDCRSLAKFTLRGIPPQPAGRARVRVTFRVDADGLLSVAAQDLTSGSSAEVEVHPTYGMSEQDFKAILEKSMAMAQHDNEVRQMKLKEDEAQQLLSAIEKALADKENPPTPAESKAITTAQQKLAQLLEQPQDLAQLQAAIKELSTAAEDFINRRMSAALQQVLR